MRTYTEETLAVLGVRGYIYSRQRDAKVNSNTNTSLRTPAMPADVPKGTRRCIARFLARVRVRLAYML